MTVIALTGASGFVASHLRPALTGLGHEVRPLSVREGVAAADVEGAAAVIHLAGESVVGRWTTAKREAIMASRRDGTRSLVEAIGAAADRPRVLIAASAVGLYGDRGDETLTEQAEPGVGFMADVARHWEAEAMRAEAAGVRVVRLRFGIILARDGEAWRRLVGPARLGALGPMGSGRQWWPWVHIDDVVGLVLAAVADERYTGAINVTAPAAERQRDLARTLGRILHRPAVLPAPAFALRLILGGFADELLTSRRAVPARAQELGYAFRQPTFEAAARDLLGR